jgi:predicted MPP superfamily phosphohydrolase
MRLPFVPPLYLPRYSGRFISGMYRVSRHQTPLYVNRGIGTSVLPLRLFCRPEMTLFEFTTTSG